MMHLYSRPQNTTAWGEHEVRQRRNQREVAELVKDVRKFKGLGANSSSTSGVTT